MAMRIVAETARLMGAPRLLPIESAHIDGALYHGDSGTLFAERLVAGGATVAVRSTLNVGALDLTGCSRQRLPVTVQLTIDGKSFYEAILEPGGLSGDGPVKVYEKFVVSAGKHLIEARLRDSKRDEGFDYESSREVELTRGQNLAIDFKAEQGGFLFR